MTKDAGQCSVLYTPFRLLFQNRTVIINIPNTENTEAVTGHHSKFFCETCISKESYVLGKGHLRIRPWWWSLDNFSPKIKIATHLWTYYLLYCIEMCRKMEEIIIRNKLHTTITKCRYICIWLTSQRWQNPVWLLLLVAQQSAFQELSVGLLSWKSPWHSNSWHLVVVLKILWVCKTHEIPLLCLHRISCELLPHLYQLHHTLVVWKLLLPHSHSPFVHYYCWRGAGPATSLPEWPLV